MAVSAQARVAPEHKVYRVGGFPMMEFRLAFLPRDTIAGFALDWSGDLTLLHYFDPFQFRLDGYWLFRNEDVRRWRGVARDELLAQAAQVNRARPVHPGGILTTNWAIALPTIEAHYGLVSMFRERIKKTFPVGRPLKVTSRSIVYRSIDQEARWEGIERIALKDITHLEFGSAYESTLHRVATARGDAPNDPTHWR